MRDVQLLNLDFIYVYIALIFQALHSIGIVSAIGRLVGGKAPTHHALHHFDLCVRHCSFLFSLRQIKFGLL
jgi:hypothetical protein